jgi:hypothetical protein
MSHTDKCLRQTGLDKHHMLWGGGASFIHMYSEETGQNLEDLEAPPGLGISPSTETLNLRSERKDLMSLFNWSNNTGFR